MRRKMFHRLLVLVPIVASLSFGTSYAQGVTPQTPVNLSVPQLPPEALHPGVLLTQLPSTLNQTWAYTTADPVRPDLLGLATQDGRYSVMLAQSCPPTLTDLKEVALYVIPTGSWIVPMTATGGVTNDVCPVQVQARMSTVPCFTDVQGACDVAQELDPTP